MSLKDNPTLQAPLSVTYAPAAGSVNYLAGYTLPAPSGGDDSAMLTAALTGTRTVIFRPGATYRYGVDTAFPAFSGKIIGNGATLAFTYSGVYHSATPINAWTNVLIEQLTFTAPNVNLFALFGPNNAGLTFESCDVFDCTPTFSTPIARDFLWKRGRIYQSATPPATIQQRIGGANSGRFVIEDATFDFAPVGSAGALVGGTDLNPSAGTTVQILRNRFLPSNLTGYTIDALIDIEPTGTTQFELISIEDNLMLNGVAYLSSAKRINVRGNEVHYTSVHGTAQATPWVIYNNNATKPATGIVCIESNDITQDPVAAAISTAVINQSIPTDEIITRGNKVRVNGASTNANHLIVINAANNKMTIDGDDIAQVGGTAQSGACLLYYTAPATGDIVCEDGKIAGTWQHLIAFTGAASTVATLDIRGINMRALTFSTGSLQAALLYLGSTTLTKAAVRNNIPLNPAGPNTTIVAAAPAVPASTTAVTNTTGLDCTVYVTGGTVTAISVAGTTTGITAGAVRVSAGQSVALTYSVAPSWVWIGD